MCGESWVNKIAATPQVKIPNSEIVLFDDGQFIISWWKEGGRCFAITGANIMHYIIIVITDALVGIQDAEMRAQ